MITNLIKKSHADLLLDSMKFVSSKIRKETVIKLLEKIQRDYKIKEVRVKHLLVYLEGVQCRAFEELQVEEIKLDSEVEFNCDSEKDDGDEK